MPEHNIPNVYIRPNTKELRDRARAEAKALGVSENLYWQALAAGAVAKDKDELKELLALNDAIPREGAKLKLASQIAYGPRKRRTRR